MLRKALILYFIIILTNLYGQSKAFTIEDLYKVKNVGKAVISNNGDKFLFTVSESNLKGSKSKTNIYIADINGNNIRQLTNNTAPDFNPIWLNDDTGFYFISYRNGSSQLYFMPLNGGEVEQITNFYMEIHSPKLSPDGNKVIFTTKIFPELGIDEETTKTLAAKMNSGPIQAHIADSLFVRHWTEYADGKYSHVILFNLETKEYRDLTPGFFNSPTFLPGGSDDYNFSPDSRRIIFSSKRVRNPEESTNSDIWMVNIDGNNLQNITKQNQAYDGHGKFSPDGKYIAYLKQSIAGYESDRTLLMLYDLKKNNHTVLTEEIDNNVNDFDWSFDSKEIYFHIDEKGYNPILKVNISSNKITRILENKSLHGFTLSPDNKSILFNYSYVHKPVEIAKLDIASNGITELTNFNVDLTNKVDFRPAEQIWIEGSNGRKIQVFLVKPHGFDSNKKYPFVINVHGGPQMQWRDSFRGDWQIYPGAGYVLAFPNPHGSTGFGAEFTKDISLGWDGNVYNDVMKVMDYLQELPYIDKNRMGAMGWSYGGYFMNLLQAKGNRFKCLASMMGIYDLEQFYLETEELWFPNFDLGGNPWEQGELYNRQSPSSYTDNFKTPTLIITGEKDYRISYTQSLRYFTALQLKGIDSRLIIFDNDGHWPSHLKSMPLYYNAHLEWFHKYLGGEPAPWDSKKLVRNQVFE